MPAKTPKSILGMIERQLASAHGPEGLKRVVKAMAQELARVHLLMRDDVIAANGGVDTLTFLERSADPPEPTEGKCVIWLSDGTGKGDDGDLLIAGKAGGATKWATLFDHSAGSAW